MKSNLFKRLSLITMLVLTILIVSQGLWLWQQLEQEKQAFTLKSKQECNSLISLHILNLFGNDTSRDSFVAEEISEKEVAQAPPSKIYKIDPEKYPTDKSMLQRLEAAIADGLLAKGQIKLTSLDSLFNHHFSETEKITSYRLQLLKNEKITDSLSRGKMSTNSLTDSPSIIHLQVPLGTKEIYILTADFQLKTLPFLKQMVYSIGISALAVILVAIFMLWLLWALQQQVAQLLWRERAVSGMVHDLKSPLSYVYTFLDYLAGKEQQPAMQEQLQNASNNVSKLIHKMEILLTLFRSKKKNIIMKPTSYRLAQKCRELLSELEIIYQEKQAEYKLSIPENLDIHVDPLYFEAALRNLLDNAFKYSDACAKLEIKAIREQKQLHICITDSGKGIPQKEQREIFQEFYRADNNSKGYGIGLAFTQQIVKAHKGHIRLESKLGKGSTFCIVLPEKVIV